MYKFRVNNILSGKIVGDEKTHFIGKSSIFLALEGDINTNTRSAMIKMDSEVVDLKDGIYDLHLKLDITENNENKIQVMTVKGAIKKDIEVGGKNRTVFTKISSDDEFIIFEDIQESSNEKIVQETLNNKENNMNNAVEMAIKDTPNLKIFDLDGNLIETLNYINNFNIFERQERCFIGFESEIFTPQFLQLKYMKDVPKLSDFEKETSNKTTVKIGSDKNDKHFKMIGDFIVRDMNGVDRIATMIVRDFKFITDRDTITFDMNEVSNFKTIIECFYVDDCFVEINFSE